MKKIAFFVTVLIITTSFSFGKTIDMDTHLSNLFNNQQYDKCYKLSKIISSNKYSEYVLAPYGIKYKESYVFVSDSAKYFEYTALRAYDLNTFNYFYMIKNKEVLSIFNKSDVYPAFINWADSLYNSPIINEFGLLVDNYISAKYKNVDDIPEIKNEHFKRGKLLEIYKFLKETDSVTCSKIFSVDNKSLVKIVKNRGNKNLLNLPSDDFNYRTCHVYWGKKDIIQDTIYRYFDSLFKVKRFINKEQISEFLFNNTNFTNEEKMFVSFYFIKAFLTYNKVGKFVNKVDIDKMILHGETVCNGYALLLQYFLNQNNIQCFKITFQTDKDKHANNLVVIDNKVYYVDVTWGIYYKDIKEMPNNKIITEWQIEPVKLNYSNIKNFNYIEDVIGYDIGIITEFKNILNKKGA
jgi:hypothetical protein